MTFRQDKFRGHNIFANGSDVLPRRSGSNNFHPAVVQFLHVFDHDHGIETFRQDIPRIYINILG